MTRNVKFDVLAFCKANQFCYPKLASVACDVLSITVSTVASESAFSVGGCVLDQYCSTLKPETVEVIICSKEWLFGSKRNLLHNTACYFLLCLYLYVNIPFCSFVLFG